jgi:hypothetical protein
MSVRELAPERVDELEDAISDILAGEHPGVQGATLASLLACWLAGHQTEKRERLLAAHNNSVRLLIPLYEGLISGRKRRKHH